MHIGRTWGEEPPPIAGSTGPTGRAGNVSAVDGGRRDPGSGLPSGAAAVVPVIPDRVADAGSPVAIVADLDVDEPAFPAMPEDDIRERGAGTADGGGRLHEMADSPESGHGRRPDEGSPQDATRMMRPAGTSRETRDVYRDAAEKSAIARNDDARAAIRSLYGEDEPDFPDGGDRDTSPTTVIAPVVRNGFESDARNRTAAGGGIPDIVADSRRWQANGGNRVAAPDGGHEPPRESLRPYALISLAATLLIIIACAVALFLPGSPFSDIVSRLVI